MGHETAKVPADNAVPCCALAVVELRADQYLQMMWWCGATTNLLLDVLRNVLDGM